MSKTILDLLTSEDTLKKFHGEVDGDNTVSFKISEHDGIEEGIYVSFDGSSAGHYAMKGGALIESNEDMKLVKFANYPFGYQNILDAKDGDVVYVVRDIPSALALEAIGKHAIATVDIPSGSNSAQANILDFLYQNYKQGRLIVVYDNTTLTYKDEGYMSYIVGKLRDEKDYANIGKTLRVAELKTDTVFDAYEEDSEKLLKAVNECEKKTDPVYEYLHGERSISNIHKRRLANRKTKKSISSGFPTLDEALGGGFGMGFYTIGAVSSLGKSTFCWQIANQMAKAGAYVMYFSLEQADTEMEAKMASCYTFLHDPDQVEHRNSLSALQLLRDDGEEYSAKTNEILDEYDKLMENEDFCGHLQVYCDEYNGYSAKKITAEVDAFIAATGKQPVVFVDYLQYLANSEDSRYVTDKQNVDAGIKELKSLAMRCQVPVVVVSSFNRDSYYNNVSLKSFKESGYIEYSSDVLLGIQYRNLEKIWGDGSKPKDDVFAKLQTLPERELEVIVLKGRLLRVGTKVPFNYAPKYNCFKPAPLDENGNPINTIEDTFVNGTHLDDEVDEETSENAENQKELTEEEKDFIKRNTKKVR